jgi:uncharacterized protein YifN (PemK superfamily)
MTTSKLPEILQGNDWWAKCDCIGSVSFDRLDRFKIGKDPRTGKRIFKSYKVFGDDLLAIKAAIVRHLCMTDLITGEPEPIL